MTAPDLDAQIGGLAAAQMRDVLTQLALAFPAAFEAALRQAQILAQAAASSANPYGSYTAGKHGRFDAPSAGEAVRDIPHLAQHIGADPVCVICRVDHDAFRRGVTSVTGQDPQFDHQPAIVRDAAALAGHMPEGAQ